MEEGTSGLRLDGKGGGGKRMDSGGAIHRGDARWRHDENGVRGSICWLWDAGQEGRWANPGETAGVRVARMGGWMDGWSDGVRPHQS